VRRRLLGRRAKLVIGSTILAAALGLAILGPWLAPHDPIQQNLMIRLRPPFWGERTVQGYWLGTDNYGRDILSRLILGTRFSILVGISAMLIAGAIGSTLGLVAGYFGGRWEQVIMRFADAYQAPLGVGVVHNLTEHVDVGARFSFDNLLGQQPPGVDAANTRSLALLLNLRS